MWKSTAAAPFDRNLQLAVIDTGGQVHALIFPCRRVLRGWINSQTGLPVYVFPTHWREWDGRIEEAPIGEPEQERLAIVEEYADDQRAIIKKDRDAFN
ncbi:hypothetical protein [Bradyrhizobium japonicum]|uniref:hypothetical protein n=1 Tax=Bradyrhizobium japonicum TaxID=375 RepID=UPI001B8A1DCB|nr:hypothetical protein [Bradyrhizobium japonicum]MBR0972314.1 hypothetical protein [Bradyrhizobium japonicum]